MSEQDIEKLDGQTLDIVEQNIAQLKQLFPSIFSEGKIQFNKLEELLGNYVAHDEDHYNFTWHGKRKAGRLAQTPSTGTLRPCKEESVDWDNTENLFIEGDNLEVLKLLQKSYHRQVKMIYIDPPYNTGNDFVYEDDFKDGVKNYLEMTGQVDSDGKKMGTNSSSAGRYHTNWLNMMYPRLKLARNLMRDDGVIFANIGEEEVSNLDKLMSEIFGDDNKISVISRVAKTASNKGTHFAPSTDFLICYAKNIQELPRFKDKVDESLYKKTEIDGLRKGEKYRDDIAFYQSSLDPMRGCTNQRYYIQAPDGTLLLPPGNNTPQLKADGENIPPETKDDKVWRWSQSTYADKKEFLVFKETKRSPLIDENGAQAKYNIYTKSYLLDRQEDGTLPRNILTDFINRKGADLIKKYGISFDYSKPIELIQYLSEITSVKSGDIILDFFAGSCSVGHGVLTHNLNAKLSANFICIQLPEKMDSSEYETVAEIGKERLRRVSNHLKEENPEYNGDLGFKVFKLDSSNIKRWDADFHTLESDLMDAADYLVKGRSDEDILYELCLKLGLDLSITIEEKTIAGKKLFILGRGYLVICLDDAITMDLVNGIGALKDELAPEDGMRVVFKDDGFKDDVVKTNALQTLKRFGIDDIKSL